MLIMLYVLQLNKQTSQILLRSSAAFSIGLKKCQTATSKLIQLSAYSLIYMPVNIC